MQLAQTFDRVTFPIEIIERGVAALNPVENEVLINMFTISRGTEYWSLDNLDEWYGEYGRGHDSATLHLERLNESLHLSCGYDRTEVAVTAKDRPNIERIMRVFASTATRYEKPLPRAEPEPEIVPVKPRIFIGHGGQSTDWRTLKDELQDRHGYDVEAYETGARSGNHIRDILDTMLEASSFALLVMTAEDETADGEWRARQNVVHEAGLFQGRLGFNRAIVIVEDGVQVFSNLDGIQHVPYAKNQIKSTVSEVLAAIRREYPGHLT